MAAEALRAGDPERIGAYLLLGRLGAGGMGEVFLARSEGGMAVAVKVVHRHMADDERFRARFRREVIAARSVSGVFTAPVVDADLDAANPWVATSFLPGVSLQEAVAARGPFAAGTVVALGGGLAEALVSIHQAGVVHRDLKPSNVMLSPDGPRVIDFGIAHAAGEARVTRAGSVIGSPGFMAPEQVRGEATGTAADVFAFGAVLAFAAMGQGPFGKGPRHVLMYRAVHTEPDLNGLIDPFLRELVGQCLDKDPARRPDPHRILERLEADGRQPADLSGTGWLPRTVADDVAHAAATSFPSSRPGRPSGPRPEGDRSSFPRPGQPAGGGGRKVLIRVALGLAVVLAIVLAAGGRNLGKAVVRELQRSGDGQASNQDAGWRAGACLRQTDGVPLVPKVVDRGLSTGAELFPDERLQTFAPTDCDGSGVVAKVTTLAPGALGGSSGLDDLDRTGCPETTDRAFATAEDRIVACGRYSGGPHPGDPGKGGGKLVQGDCVLVESDSPSTRNDRVLEWYCGSRRPPFAQILALAPDAARCPAGALSRIAVPGASGKVMCLGQGTRNTIVKPGQCIQTAANSGIAGTRVGCSGAGRRLVSFADDESQCAENTSAVRQTGYDRLLCLTEPG